MNDEDTGIKCRANRRRLMAQKKINYSTHNALGRLLASMPKRQTPTKDFRDLTLQEIQEYYGR
jgi:hypothetical protein